MKANNKIVFMDGMFPAIFFPIGLPENGGSCAYMTENCYQYCPCHEINKHEKRALLFFQNNSMEVIANRILGEISELSIMHLYWFPWGDCLPTLTNKISNIMLYLSDMGILQNGFTRNRMLWNLIPNNIDNLKIGYHAETKNEAKELSKTKVVCCPDVLKGKGVLYYKEQTVARCCGIWCEWVKMQEIRIADCQECYLYKQGCFIGR